MNWKQPTPTDINYNENLDFLDRSIFREILSLCQNEPYLCKFTHAGRYYQIELQRGQCILKIAKIAKELKIDRKKVTRSLTIISNFYENMDIKGMPFGCIVTLKNYDEIISMDNNGTIAGQKKDNKRTANKSEENDKNEKNEKNIYISNEMLSIDKLYFKNKQIIELTQDLVDEFPHLQNMDIINALIRFGFSRYKKCKKVFNESLIRSKMKRMQSDHPVKVEFKFIQATDHEWQECLIELKPEYMDRMNEKIRSLRENKTSMVIEETQIPYTDAISKEKREEMLRRAGPPEEKKTLGNPTNIQPDSKKLFAPNRMKGHLQHGN